MTPLGSGRRRGFTLLEILIAAGMVGAALVAVAGAIQTSGRRVMDARRMVVASRLARAKLSAALVQKDPDDAVDAGVDEHSGMRWKVAVRQEAFELAEMTMEPRTRVVEVDVTWLDGKRSISLVARRAAPQAGGGR